MATQRQATVTLGGRQYTITPPPIRQSKAWREKLAVPFATLSVALESAGTLELDIRQMADIAELVRRFSGVLIGSIDTVLDLLFEYSPVLASDREWIEQNAYDDEALEAFMEVLKLAYPLGTLGQILSGPTVSRTSSNSRSRSGGSGTKSATAKKGRG